MALSGVCRAYMLIVMAFIDCVKWKPEGSEFIFSFHYPESNLSTYTQLIVHESQEALLFSKGTLMRKFGPGERYPVTLNTENLPLLRSLYGIPFGGKNPFTADIWFINKLHPANLSWNVCGIPVQDADYNTYLPLMASGQYGLEVKDSERFLINMVGQKDVFSEKDMLSQADGELSSKIKTAIVQFMSSQRVGFKGVSAHLDSLSSYLKQYLSSFWAEYGLELTKFYISDIAIDDTTPEGMKIADALARQASMSITGHSWQQEQMFSMANNAVDQIGNASGGNGMLAGLMAMNMMGGSGMVGGMAGGLMQTHNNQPTFSGNPGGQQQGGVSMADNQAGAKVVYCANCSKKHLSTERFCPHCGSEYNPCPRCGSDNPKTARRCVTCGTPLQQPGMVTVCSSCGASLQPGALFCPQCGARQGNAGNGTICPRCNSSVPSGSRFCPKCGQKIM